MKNCITLCFFMILITNSKAQTVTASTGGKGVVGSMEVSYSVGEAVVTTVEGDSVLLTQGFHQPSFAVTAIKKTFPPGAVTVFPNPTKDYLNVVFKGVSLKNIQILLFDVAGKIKSTAVVHADTWQIDFSQLAPGFYILVVTERGKGKLDSFKILKTN